jgi:hypothetical protein
MPGSGYRSASHVDRHYGHDLHPVRIHDLGLCLLRHVVHDAYLRAVRLGRRCPSRADHRGASPDLRQRLLRHLVGTGAKALPSVSWVARQWVTATISIVPVMSLVGTRISAPPDASTMEVCASSSK